MRNRINKRMSINERIFILSATTIYTAEDIQTFMFFTGLKIKDTEKVMANFMSCGISNLTDVITLVKMGYFHYS